MNINSRKKFTKTKIALIASLGLNLVQAAADDTTEVIVSAKEVRGGEFYPATQSVRQGGQATILVSPQFGYKLKAIQGCGGRYENMLFIIPKATYSCTVTAEFSQISDKQATFNNQTTTSSTAMTDNNSAPPPSSSAGLSTKKLKLLLIADYVTNYITANAVVTSGEGTITPSSQQIRRGSTATFTINPAQGYIVSSASGCGISEADSGKITTPALSENCTIAVEFAVQQRNLWDQFSWDNATWG
jgi:hypothetical protein